MPPRPARSLHRIIATLLQSNCHPLPFSPSVASSFSKDRFLTTSRCRGRTATLAIFPRIRIHPVPTSPARIHKVRFVSAISKSRYRGRTAHEKEDLLRTFRSYGIPDENSATILTKLPEIVYYHPENTLKPKLEFLHSSGITGIILGNLLAANPHLLVQGLQTKIVPCVNFLKEIFPEELSPLIAQVLRKHYSMVSPTDRPRVEVLRKHGVTIFGIVKILITYPLVLAVPTERLDRAVQRVKKMGINIDTVAFGQAVSLLSLLKEETIKKKLDLYLSLGWQEDEIFRAFRKLPRCLLISDDRIRRKAVFFQEVLGWDMSLVSKNPALLMYSIEKRFKPRGAVLNLLMLKGLIRRNMGSMRFMMAEKKFFELYVKKYENVVAGIVDAYEGRMMFQGWEQGCPEKVYQSKK